MSDECVYMGSVACLTHHSVRRLEEDQDSCDWLRAEKAEADALVLIANNKTLQREAKDAWRRVDE